MGGGGNNRPWEQHCDIRRPLFVQAAWPLPACQCVCLVIRSLLTLQITPASVIHSVHAVSMAPSRLIIWDHPEYIQVTLATLDVCGEFCSSLCKCIYKIIIQSSERYLKNDFKYNIKRHNSVYSA